MSDKKPGAPRVSPEGTETRCLTITKEHIAELITINPNISKALRQVMNERKGHSNAYRD
jgi:hypothetical protein